MDKFEAGMLAKSKAGHDTGKIYVIADTDDAYVYLVDGKIRIILKQYETAGADDGKIRQILKTWNQKEG